MPARPPGRVHLSAAAAAANDMASADVEAGTDGESVGAVKHVAGAGGINRVDRIGRLAMDNAVLKPGDAIGAARHRGHATAELRDSGQRRVIARTGKAR